jgi:microsomal prostaglandin-E synthase 1
MYDDRMTNLTSNPAFVAYALSAVVLCLNLLFLWNWSGVTRTRTKTTLNSEDAVTVVRGAAVVEGNPAPVARVLRAHRNAFDNTMIFLVLGALYVLTGASALGAQIYFGVYTGARLLYTITYLNELQPWRSVVYAISVLATFGLVVQVLMRVLGGG